MARVEETYIFSQTQTGQRHDDAAKLASVLVTLNEMVARGTCRRGNSIAAIMNPGVSLARQ